AFAALPLKICSKEPHDRLPRAVSNLRLFARPEEAVAHAGIDVVAVLLVVGPDRRVHVGETRVDARVVLGVDAEPGRPEAGDRHRVRAGAVAHHERPQRWVVRRVAETLPTAPTEADHPHAIRSGRLEPLYVCDRRVGYLCDRFGVEGRNELARVVRRWRRAPPPRQEVGSDGAETAAGELLRG